MTTTCETHSLLLTIPVGPEREAYTIHPVRTAEQRATVLALVNQPEFESACGNPFEPEVRFTGAMTFMWYDLEQRLHATRIAPDGEILRQSTSQILAN